MIGVIARKEFIDLRRDGRYRLAAGLILILLVASSLVGWRIHGSKASLEQAVIAGEQIGKGVRSFIRKWRSLGDSNPCFRRERGITCTLADSSGLGATL